MTQDVSQDIEMTLKSLKANRFDARFAQTAVEAKKMMLEMNFAKSLTLPILVIFLAYSPC